MLSAVRGAGIALAKGAGSLRQSTPDAPLAPIDPSDTDGRAAPLPQLTGGAPPLAPVTFALLVALPTLATLAYFLILAAPQYVSEMRFVVRGSVERLTLEGGFGPSAALSALNNNQEAHIVADFIRSRDMVETLSQDHDLRAIYALPQRDFLTRLDPQSSVDEINRYWRRMVETSVESTSGVVTVRITAFTPEHARELAASVLAASEVLVNDFTERLRREMVMRAEREVAAARAELAGLLDEFETTRNDRGAINALTSATAIQELASTLRAERASREAALAAAASRLGGDAPSIVRQENEIAALNERIAELDAALSAVEPAETISQFSAIEARRHLLTQRVARTETAAVDAKLAAVRQQVYLDVFMPPTLAETAYYPRPFLIALATFAALFAIWSLGGLYVAGVIERAR